MNVVGIVAEYNPMHNGHVYHIEEAKNKANADYAIIIMSGSFTEQGNIAVFNKFDRARVATYCGADLVIELPTIHAISSSENFAYNAVKILNSLGIVTHIAFGSESSSIETLDNIAEKEITYKNEIILRTKDYMKEGISSIAAKDKALKEFLNATEYAEISKPNNILAIQYLISLKRLESKIKAIAIKRAEVNHNDKQILSNAIIASSTGIRNVLLSKEYIKKQKQGIIQKVVPKECFNLFLNSTPKTNEDLWQMLKYEIIRLGTKKIANIYEVSEGLENRIYSSALISDSYNSFISNIKCKRYPLSRIKRLCIYILLGVTRDVANSICDVSYARVLKIKKDSISLLTAIANSSKTPLITKITDESLKSLNEDVQKSIGLDILANKIHQLEVLDKENDYTNNIIV